MKVRDNELQEANEKLDRLQANILKLLDEEGNACIGVCAEADDDSGMSCSVQLEVIINGNEYTRQVDFW